MNAVPAWQTPQPLREEDLLTTRCRRTQRTVRASVGTGRERRGAQKGGQSGVVRLREPGPTLDIPHGLLKVEQVNAIAGPVIRP